MKRTILFALVLALFACPAALADEPYTEDDIPGLLETIHSLEEKIEQLEAELETYRQGEWHDDSPAAEFIGGVVTVADARAEYETRRYYYEIMGVDPDAIADEIKLSVLQDLAEDAVLRTKAAELGVAEPSGETAALIEQEALARYQDYRDYYTPYQHDPSLSDEENEEKLTRYLEESGMGTDDVFRQVQMELWSYQAELFSLVTKDVALSEDELLTYYNEAVESARTAWEAGSYDYDSLRAGNACVVYHPPGYRNVSAFLIPMDDASLAEFYEILVQMEEEGADQASLLARMDELYAALEGEAAACLSELSSGGDMSEIAARYSAETNEYALSAGSYDLYDGAFLSAALAIPEPGELTSAQGSGGIWIIRYDSDIVEGAVPLELVADELAEIALREKQNAFYAETMEKWLEEADIHLYPERF